MYGVLHNNSNAKRINSDNKSQFFLYSMRFPQLNAYLLYTVWAYYQYYHTGAAWEGQDPVG